jgi:hypothetical protein
MSALDFLSSGNYNTAVGEGARGGSITPITGSDNIALGYNAGINYTTGSFDIYIGNKGVAAESNTVRIGTQGTQTATFIAGVTRAHVSFPLLLFVNSKTGQLSSARYKRDIRDMGDASGRLIKLRPVTFRYKQDPDSTEHTAEVEGDGAGFDVRSFHTDGSPTFIEVKTTRGEASTEFYISRSELHFS